MGGRSPLTERKPASNRTRRTPKLLLASLACLVPLSAAAPPAFAGVGFSAVPALPSPVTVGSTGLPGSFSITNDSNGAEAAGSVTLCAGPDATIQAMCTNAGLPAQSLLLTPSCGSITPGQACAAGFEDPGVFRLSTTGTGEMGTACAGTSFAISSTSATSGQYVFVPAATIVLAAPGGAPGSNVCVIDFTFDVVKGPAKPLPGSGTTTPAKTEQLGADAGFSNVNNNPGSGIGTNTVLINRATLPVTTQVTPPTLALGASFTDTAALGPVPAGQAIPTGTVTFNVYGPGDTGCTGAVLFTSTNPVNAAGTSATSLAFTPTPAMGPGTYRVIATYSGDASYLGSVSSCGDPKEAVVVSVLTPMIGVTKVASPTSRVAPGGDFTFTVTVSNPSTNDPIRITALTDNVYGNIATRAGSTCGTLIGVTLAPGQTSAPCTFTGPFTGNAGASQTDTVTVTGIDAGGTTATATAQATVTLTPVGAAPAIMLTKSASPATRVAPGGNFTFTAKVTNPSTTTPVTITKLVDNIYGDLATRAGSTCGALIGVTLAPGASSSPCTFTGAFSGAAGASQTDVITVTGMNGAVTVTATAQATVSLTPAPDAAVSPAKLSVPAACVKAPFKAYITGSSIAHVTFYVDGKKRGSVSKRDSRGRFALTISTATLSKGKVHRLTAVLQPVPHSGQPVRTVRRNFAICAPLTAPRFTG